MAEQNRASMDMCEHCFDVIIHHLNKKKNGSSSNGNRSNSLSSSRNSNNNNIENIESTPSDYPCTDQFPLFVTWKKKPVVKSRNTFFKSLGNQQEEEFHLRGCIGTFSPLSLSEGLKQYALIAAFKDSRFDPVCMDEVPQLKCGVSLLVEFEELANVYDWEVGSHGIRIRFEANSRSYNGTYLPEVAMEQKWSKEETLSSLIRKTGYKGKITQDLLDDIDGERYQSSKVGMTYEEYVECKKSNSTTNRDKQESKIANCKSLSSVGDLEDEDN